MQTLVKPKHSISSYWCRQILGRRNVKSFLIKCILILIGEEKFVPGTINIYFLEDSFDFKKKSFLIYTKSKIFNVMY